MPSYRFSIRDETGNNRENDGLAEDDEAVNFGNGVIRDLLEGNVMRYTRWTMDITQSQRAMIGMPFGGASVG